MDLNGLKTVTDLNVLPFDSYHVLVKMDWLESHHAILNCRDKVISCLDDEGQQVEVKGVPRPISLRPISALQVRRCLRKKCQVYAAYVEDTTTKEVN